LFFNLFFKNLKRLKLKNLIEFKEKSFWKSFCKKYLKIHEIPTIIKTKIKMDIPRGLSSKNELAISPKEKPMKLKTIAFTKAINTFQNAYSLIGT